MAGGAARNQVVIVGGGAGGSLLAYLIQDVADVVLIDQKEYFEISWASLRATVEPSFADRSLINHKDYLPKVTLCTSSANNVSETEIRTSNGDVFPYDFLVVATGHTEPNHKKRAEKLEYYKTQYEKIKSSKSVLIIGGGPTGVELAGEIAVDFPEKSITLVHRGPRLIDFVNAKASAKALKWLGSRKVNVLLNESVDMEALSNGYYRTSKGDEIKADCHFLCTGSAKGSAWLRDSILRSSLDENGRLMVDEHLVVKGQKNVFAIGDVTDVKEMKQGYLARNHAQVVAKNLKNLVSGSGCKMAAYSPGAEMAIVTLGRKEAVAQLPFVTLSGWIPGKIKSGDLFVGKTRKELGLTP